jgi:hypothetical protein
VRLEARVAVEMASPKTRRERFGLRRLPPIDE